MSKFKGVKVHRTVNPRTYGHIPGIPVGTRWDRRIDCSRDGVHAPLRAGIHGSSETGAYSIVMSGGYEDDVDHGETFDYTGQGGRDLDGDQLDKIRGKVLWDGPQSADQEWKLGNKALRVSAATGMPVRVVRGSNMKNSKYCPTEGYRYDGLYTVVEAWQEKGKANFLMCKFRFERVRGQPPVPVCGAPIASSSRKCRPASDVEDPGSDSDSDVFSDTEVQQQKHTAQGSAQVKEFKPRRKTAVMDGITFKYEGS